MTVLLDITLWSEMGCFQIRYTEKEVSPAIIVIFNHALKRNRSRNLSFKLFTWLKQNIHFTTWVLFSEFARDFRKVSILLHTRFIRNYFKNSNFFLNKALTTMYALPIFTYPITPPWSSKSIVDENLLHYHCPGSLNSQRALPCRFGELIVNSEILW